MCVPYCPCCFLICGRYNSTKKIGNLPSSALGNFTCEKCKYNNCHAVILQDKRKCHCCFLPMPCCASESSPEYLACSNCHCLIDGAVCPNCRYMGREGVFCGNCGERKRPSPDPQIINIDRDNE